MLIVSSIVRMIVHYILTLLINFTIAQFPDHIDLQKIVEVTDKNEKYNILKPTVHKITDYFEDFMLRSGSRKDEKIFIDNDGFRHFWSGVGVKSKKILRKSYITLYEINRNDLDTTKSDESDDDTKSSEEGIKIPILRQATAKPKATPAKPLAHTVKPQPQTAKPKAAPVIEKLKGGGLKKVATTSFFCPFLGVIKMTSIID